MKATDCLIRSVEGSLVTSDIDRALVRRSNKVLKAVLKPSEGNLSELSAVGLFRIVEVAQTRFSARVIAAYESQDKGDLKNAKYFRKFPTMTVNTIVTHLGDIRKDLGIHEGMFEATLDPEAIDKLAMPTIPATKRKKK